MSVRNATIEQFVLASPALVFLEERRGVAHADPYPRPGVPLVTFTQEDMAAVTRDRGESGLLKV
jgi:hypothetical protein